MKIEFVVNYNETKVYVLGIFRWICGRPVISFELGFFASRSEMECAALSLLCA